MTLPSAAFKTALLFLLCLLTLGCQQDIPRSEFDARGGGSAVNNLTFRNVSTNRSLDRGLLSPPQDPYLLGPGDVLEIEIAAVPGTLAKTFVMPDGMVYYNLAGGVRAEGLTQAEFNKELTQALRRDYTRPILNMSLVEVRSRRYWILGRVSRPGIFPLRQPTTLLEAISTSGGMSVSRQSGTTQELADLSNSIVMRDGDILPVDFGKLIRDGDTGQNIYLRHNDFIYIPSSASSTVQLLGAVQSPQAVPYRDSLTLVDCIAQGRGTTRDAYLREVVIVRGTFQKPTAATVNFNDILNGRATNVVLQPGDIVWVPRRPLGLLETTVKTIFRDAARSVATTNGARLGGNNEDPVISIPVGP